MTAHKLILAAPGTGTITDLQAAAGEGNYVYLSLRNLATAVSTSEFLAALDDASNRAVAGQKMSIILDDVMALTGEPKAGELINALYVWGNENPTLPITFNWVISTIDPALAMEITSALVFLA